MGLNKSRPYALLAVDGGATVDIAKLHTGLLRQLLEVDGREERVLLDLPVPLHAAAEAPRGRLHEEPAQARRGALAEVRLPLRLVVDDVVENEGIVLKSNAAFIQGIFGIAGEKRGDLLVVSSGPGEELTANQITADMKGKILIGGSFLSLEAYKKALSVQVAGIVVGGFNYYDLKAILGYNLGVAITGTEKLNTALIVTEGYGSIPMSEATFSLLKENDGKAASINGATQIRAGVIRPEIVIPIDSGNTDNDSSSKIPQGIQEGSTVRVIRSPNFGKIGKVISLPSELNKMESETMVRVAEINIDGNNILIPRANLEMVETE